GQTEKILDKGKICVAPGGVELLGRRQDESIFEIEIGITTMPLDSGTRYLGVIRDNTEKRKARRQLDHLNRQNEMILKAAGEGIFGLDLEGRTIFVNPAAAELVGYTREELMGQKLHDLVHHTRPDGSAYPWEECPVQQTLGESKELHIPHEYFWRKDGVRFPIEFSCKPIVERDNLIGAVVIFRNISERLKTELDLQRYAGDLEKINEEMTNFTSVASHDLQEPLRKVVTLTDRLRMTNEANLDDKGRDYLDRIVRSVERMQQLINDLLEYSRTTSTRHHFEMVPLEKEVQEVLSAFEVHIEQTNAQVEVGPLPILEASRFQMRQLFQNLIGNALKFHKPDAPPIISIQAYPRQTGDWTILIQDEGIGFDEKYLDRIFKPFQRLQGKGDYEGSGMGLAICQKIVAGHHGEITAQSQPGVGTRFMLTLPAKQNPLS
ncbi:MAG: ATP-binding protein, partial [Nitrospinaceae bacterium]